MTDELVALAREIIDGNRYLVLGTADADGLPWTCPVWYAPDGYGEFLWVSRPQTQHSRNVEARRQVSIVIFDSSLPPGSRQAVYASATAGLVADTDLERSMEIFSARSRQQGLSEWTVAEVSAPAEFRLYRAVPTEYFLIAPHRPDIRIPLDPAEIR
jgi:hypothetical protein